MTPLNLITSVVSLRYPTKTRLYLEVQQLTETQKTISIHKTLSINPHPIKYTQELHRKEITGTYLNFLRGGSSTGSICASLTFPLVPLLSVFWLLSNMGPLIKKKMRTVIITIVRRTVIVIGVVVGIRRSGRR